MVSYSKIALKLVSQSLLGIQVKLPEPNAFYGDHTQDRVWLSAVYYHFTAVGLG